MATTTRSLDLSPSVYHRYRMDHTTQSLAYRRGDVKAWQGKLRRKLKQLMGYPPTAGKRVPLKPRTLWKRDHKLGSIEKITFQAEPHSDVLAYVCLPHDVEPPYRWFICVQGHSTGMHNSIGMDYDEAKLVKIEGDRDFALSSMANGFAALCIEQRSFGYRKELVQKMNQPMCHDATSQALMLGTTLMAERIFDVDRGLDYLYTRKDVDRKCIGLMGNSGGGTITLFATAVLPRITAAMPSCYFCTFRDSIMSIHHCPDNYVPGLLQYAEMADIGGLIAPRPMVVVSGKEDDIFPIGAAKRAFRDLRKIYTAAGAADRVKHVIGHRGHQFYAKPAWPVMVRLLG